MEEPRHLRQTQTTQHKRTWYGRGMIGSTLNWDQLDFHILNADGPNSSPTMDRAILTFSIAENLLLASLSPLSLCPGNPVCLLWPSQFLSLSSEDLTLIAPYDFPWYSASIIAASPEQHLMAFYVALCPELSPVEVGHLPCWVDLEVSGGMESSPQCCPLGICSVRASAEYCGLYD